MRRKGLVLILVSLVLVLFCVFSGNGQSASEKVIKLRVADMSPPHSNLVQCLEWWGSEIEKRTQGQVKFEYYWSASLLKGMEQMSSVANNLIQATPYYAAYHPDKAPLPVISGLPLICSKGTIKGSLKASDEFYRTTPDLQMEYKGNNVNYMFPLIASYPFLWSKVPIRTISDLQGLTMRAFGIQATLLSSLGCSMVNVELPEVYNVLERGVVKATWCNLSLGTTLRIYEVCKYINITNLGSSPYSFVMNLDTWNGLPDNVKKVIEDINQNYMIPKIVEIEDNNYNQQMNIVKKYMETTEFSASDLDKIIEKAKNVVWESYTKNLDAKGVHGTENLQHFLTLFEKYKNY